MYTCHDTLLYFVLDLRAKSATDMVVDSLGPASAQLDDDSDMDEGEEESDDDDMEDEGLEDIPEEEEEVWHHYVGHVVS